MKLCITSWSFPACTLQEAWDITKALGIGHIDLGLLYKAGLDRAAVLADPQAAAAKVAAMGVKPSNLYWFFGATHFEREISNPALSENHRLLMLRTSAITHYWSAAQVRQLVALITYQRRVDAAIMLFRRTVDPAKFVDVVYNMLKPSERKALRLRLGEGITPMLPEAERALDTEEELLKTRGMVKPKEPAPGAEGEAGVVFLTEEGAEGSAEKA